MLCARNYLKRIDHPTEMMISIIYYGIVSLCQERVPYNYLQILNISLSSDENRPTRAEHAYKTLAGIIKKGRQKLINNIKKVYIGMQVEPFKNKYVPFVWYY